MRPIWAQIVGVGLLLGAILSPGSGSAQTALPNWNGVWERVGGITFDPTLPRGVVDSPPYNAEYAARYRAILEGERIGKPFSDPSAQCLPPGMPRVMNMVYPLEVIVAPGKVTLIAEWMSQVRHIYTDGRPLPTDPEPTFNGYSIGRWQGGELLVETVGMRGDTVFNAAGAPHSESMVVRERFWQVDADTLKAEITVNDPKAFTKPWTVVKTYSRRPNWDLLEYVCEENNRNPVDENGVTGVILTSKTGGQK